MTSGHFAAVAADLNTTNSTLDRNENVTTSDVSQGLDQKPISQQRTTENQQGTAGLLKFSEVSSDISHLHFTSRNAATTLPTLVIKTHDPDVDRNTPASRKGADKKNLTPITDATDPTTGPDNRNLPPSAVRKTSPGLAARLKALGFGSISKPASAATPSNDRIGRLDELQLRQLDEKHQASSAISIVSRRGRPWKGSSKSTAVELESTSAPSTVESLQLPEIRTVEPLVMDTQKYRLPDHTNGNGTKVTLNTRREHIERRTLPVSPDEVATPPLPPPKDTPPAIPTPSETASTGSDYIPGLSSYFTPGHNRPGSIYTLSRASFANQLAQLTSLQLPDAESLSSKVSALPTAQIAAKALINAAEQIKSWISKASEVIDGLDSEDDVEWAAAGGREGLDEVEMAIARFEELIDVYVGAIEGLQSRQDIANVDSGDLKRAVGLMEGIVQEWSKIRNALHAVRAQVEIAMEWEELWNSVLGDIQGEMDELGRLVFEMEERRHKSIAMGNDGVDIGDLEDIVEDSPSHPAKLQPAGRFSLAALPATPGSPGAPSLSQDDSSLLALFARMQPLRASLDFLPMRLSVFENRAKHTFPTACEELDMRKDALDGSYKKLEKDAEVLRKELGEDRWVVVFRGAGRQAQKMHESVERSMVKLREALDAEMHLTNKAAMHKKMEGYEAKKLHYGPAIERVLSIIDKGVKDRLTVNGEVLRLHSDLQQRWASLKQQIHEMDTIVDDIHADRKGQQLRDSISSMLSNDRSTLGSGQETPTSSPPSSVIMSSLGFDPHTPVVSKHSNPRSSSSNPGSQPGNRRHSSLPAPNVQLARRAGGSRLTTIPSTSASTTMGPNRTPQQGSQLGQRPKWSVSTNAANVDTGHNFKPLNVTTPSPYAKTNKTPTTQRSGSSVTPSSASKLPSLRERLGRAGSESPKVTATPTPKGHSRLLFRDRLASPGPYAQQNLVPSLTAQESTSSQGSNRRASFQPPRAASRIDEHSQTSRPSSSLASSSQRASHLPQPNVLRKKQAEPKDSKPRWR